MNQILEFDNSFIDECQCKGNCSGACSGCGYYGG